MPVDVQFGGDVALVVLVVGDGRKIQVIDGGIDGERGIRGICRSSFNAIVDIISPEAERSVERNQPLLGLEGEFGRRGRIGRGIPTCRTSTANREARRSNDTPSPSMWAVALMFAF